MKYWLGQGRIQKNREFRKAKDLKRFKVGRDTQKESSFQDKVGFCVYVYVLFC